MLSPLLDQKRKPSNIVLSSPFTALSSSPGPLSPKRLRAHGPDLDHGEAGTLGDDEEDEEDNYDEDYGHDNENDYNENEDEDEPLEATPLLPIFSASHLDSLPTYSLTHAIRLLITARCETTLSWDQLRSPQVSQFLLKPIQQQIRASHFSRATLYALLANCLQFKKEVGLNPGNSGASNTRAMVCELLAIKLLKEYSTRELIDALSYDFYPLQGQSPPMSSSTLRPSSWDTNQRAKLVSPSAVRISCLEIAIRAQAKRFLAHPVVVQQLEAIWAGNIVFHSAADSLHRQPVKIIRPSPQSYGSFTQTDNYKNNHNISGNQSIGPRRSVTLYNPRDASLFKLSRLRVPRYRQVLSTMSFAILLGLFLQVIQHKPLEITSLELVFWFWSAGFMLDELVGFNEQGFSLYLMSFWNTFDVGILVLLFCYYCLRIYSVLAPDSSKQAIANNAYDVLAANAVLLLPRLFSVLDHYRYFSQLLIAFRMMAADLVAVLTLIVIACSGFFVAFTFSFGSGNPPTAVIYALFQMLMGFTPAAWQLWNEYNPLGKAILILFLFICHFLVVTILITVLTNSFMAIVQNANEEHQFVFAVNTLSMVKSDALFSYVAPTNVLAWLIAPLRFLMPFPKFVKLNRTVIKITHLPILFTIYLYERTVLRSSVFEPTDLVDGHDQTGVRRSDCRNHFDPFAHRGSRRVREPSIATHQKDRALEEVFRHPFQNSTHRETQISQNQRASNAVDNWMQSIEPETAIAPPEEQDINAVERFEKRRFWRHGLRGYPDRLNGTLRNFTETTQSVASDPEDLRNSTVRRRLPHLRSLPIPEVTNPSQHTDMEGDDELTSSDNGHDNSNGGGRPSMQVSEQDDCQTQSSTQSSDWGLVTPQKRPSRPSTAKLLSRRNSPSRRHKSPQRHHFRNSSAATILYNPTRPQTDYQSSDVSSRDEKVNLRSTYLPGGSSTPHKRSPKSHNSPQAFPRPIMPPRTKFMSVPNNPGLAWPHTGRRHSSLTLDLGSDLGDNKAIGGGFIGAIPSSFATQMAYATGGLRRPAHSAGANENQDMLSKLVLARMKALEEGFREVIREIREMRVEGDVRERGKFDEMQMERMGREREKKRKREGVRPGSRGAGKGKVNTETGSDCRVHDDISEGDPMGFFDGGSS
ncbi:hypothetical protein AJ79_03012 [Helicocarpus griseus UAMH5409]|uniref:Uncharacterized protein n=1 Tax=Helicocarpus griseus UAMH5409 TaxID=1447875 RepID=A0A2B7Y021_9EURO|nr:hypothetical protein AJ79_03012 [Helicocarpus griseus UAMH5409]